MKVGIYARWQRRDTTYAAVQIAELMSLRQHEVTILTPTPTRPAVSGFWDHRVRHDAQVKFADWAAPLAAVIWMFWPQPAQVEWANKAGKRTILVPDWADMAAIGEVGPRFHRIMAATRRWAAMLRNEGVRVAACPWSPMLPVTLRALTRPVRVYVPPHDRPGDVDDALAVDIVEAMLDLDRDVQATISTDGHRGAVVKRLERLAKASRRLTLARPEDYHRQVLRFGEHSLTLLAPVVENMGMSALCSLHMGTPIIGLDVPPFDEIAAATNAIVVPARGDPLDFLESLMTLIQGPRLAQLFDGCPGGLERRRAEFEHAWAMALAPGGTSR
jgi:hypothetical protein